MSSQCLLPYSFPLDGQYGGHWQQFGSENVTAAFVRPNAGLKTFTGPGAQGAIPPSPTSSAQATDEDNTETSSRSTPSFYYVNRMVIICSM
jgi:hypothetical protein